MPQDLRLRTRLSLALLALLPIFLIACASEKPPEPNRKLKIVATTGMIADLATQICGELGDVEALMGPGIDPHLYKASEGDVRRLAEADLVLYNGLFLEGKMGDILSKIGATKKVVAVSEAIPNDLLRQPPQFEGHNDPHIWFDVSLWERTVAPIVDALAGLRPEQTASFQKNGLELRQRLTELDAWAAARMAEIPVEQRVLVTAHDAFGYFGERYGLEVLAIQGISTLSEAGLQDVERVVEIVAQRKIKAIFVESSVPARTIEAVQAAVRAQGHEVKIGGSLYSDAMGTAGTPEGTYDGMVRANVNTIVEALK